MKNDRKPSENGSSPLQLLHRAGQCADELFAVNVSETDLTPRQYTVLRAVQTSQDPSQTKLVEATGIDRSTLADIVRRLVGKGLLQRKRSRHDARMYVVRLTERGSDALSRAEPAAHSADQRILAPLAPSEREQFLKALRRIVDTIVPQQAAGTEH